MGGTKKGAYYKKSDPDLLQANTYMGDLPSTGLKTRDLSGSDPTNLDRSHNKEINSF